MSQMKITSRRPVISLIPLVLILWALLSLLITSLTRVSAQTCRTNLITNTFTPSFLDYCPVGWINTGNKCERFADIWKAKLGSGCTTSWDCKFSSLSCINNVCSPLNRMEGDTCTEDSQCAQNVYSKFSSACFNGRCRPMTLIKTAKVGETCNVKNVADNTISDCAEGHCALASLFNSIIPGLITSKCVKTSQAKKGETCGFKYTLLPPAITDYITCESGTTCSLVIGGTCVPVVQEGQACSLLDLSQQCETNTYCRRRSATASTTCEYKAPIGEYCDTFLDCAFVNSGMVSCENNKCVRKASRPNGQGCTSNDQCYSRYCDSSTGKCSAYAGKETCSTSSSCTTAISQGCGCAGKETDSNLGKCVASCEGQLLDLKACLYNLGMYYYDSITPSQSLGYSQYSDETSTAFRSCRYYYDQFYGCMKQTWNDAGISNLDSSMPGLGLGSGVGDGNSLLLPERNGSESLLMNRSMVVVMLVMVVLLALN
ncbi:hypothetical protein FDP41_013297 [Naegleria fowleri]|uniref:Dickkopf N-terminal cysteine-rich domain-containing protein n=1 Tax=Naegleria fowleri TaxID=5763 RepID=A0A6A5C2N9_NAEFO|nr:uncharacterized protein FDP41_013297 [Naegleria fowleri]KAF0980814.1 hypothetical protein FDP41_013297 [Naegleria fowleri]